MESEEKDQVNRLPKDISSTESVLNKNSPLLQKLFLPANFKMISMIGGLSIMGFAVVIHLLIRQFGSYERIPGNYRLIIYGLIAIDCFVIAAIKLKTLLSIEWNQKKVTYWQITKAFYSSPVVHVHIPIVIVSVLLCFVFVAQDRGYFIIPSLAFGFGFLYNFYGSIMRAGQYLIAGYWFMGTGCIVLVFSDLSVTAALFFTQGCGHLLLGLICPSPKSSPTR